MKLRFMTRMATEHVQQRAGTLTKGGGMKEIRIRREMNEEERNSVLVESRGLFKKGDENRGIARNLSRRVVDL